MNKRELKQYRAICCSIKQLDREIEEMTEKHITVDGVQGSMRSLPYALHNVTVTGIDASVQPELNALRARLVAKKNRYIRMRDQIENYLDSLDEETAAILRARYIERQKWRDIAQSLGRTPDSVRMKAKRIVNNP